MAQLPGIGPVLRVVQAQAEALAGLPDAVVALNRSVRALSRSLDQTRETLVTMQRLTARADQLLTDLDEPVRALAPGMRRLATVLNDPVIEDIPAVLRQLEHDLLPVVGTIRDTQQKVTSIASSTARMSTLIDETGSRLSALPGASFLLRPRSADETRSEDPEGRSPGDDPGDHPPA